MPGWIGHPMTTHWGVEDPAAAEGADFEKMQAFSKAARFLKNHIMAFISLPIGSIDRLALEAKLREIGHMEGTTGSNSEVA